MTSTDNRTLDRAVARPFPGFDQFYETAFPLVAGRVSIIVGHQHLAEDLTQDAMVEMMCQWNDRRDRSIKDNIAWVVGIAVNLTRRHQRRLVTGARALARLAGWERPAVVPIEIDVLARSETYRRIAGLPKQQRAVVILWVLEDMAVEDIAKTLGITSSTVRTHVQRIRRQLVDDQDHEFIADDQPPMHSGRRQG